MSFGGNLTGRLSGYMNGHRTPVRFNASTFDTGLVKSQRATVQDAVIDLLQRLLRGNGGYLESVAPTTTVVRDDEQSIGLILDEMNGQAPSVLVATGDKGYAGAGDSDRYDAKLTVHVYLFVNSLRSRMARAVGDVVNAADFSADPGSYVILEHCEELLIGRNAGARKVLKRLRPVAEHLIVADQNYEIWEQRYTVDAARTINSNRDIDLELKQIETYSRFAVQAPADQAIVETETDL